MNQKLDAQRQYVVIGTLALLIIVYLLTYYMSRAAAPKGAMPSKIWKPGWMPP